jgi:hypothetical protein
MKNLREKRNKAHHETTSKVNKTEMDSFIKQDPFLSALKQTRADLKHLKIHAAFNSLGSNLAIEFGESIAILLTHREKDLLKEWSIWIGNASWRIAKNGKYVVGSGDDKIFIQLQLEQLLGKRFRSIQFLSQFLDVEFGFDKGYQLTTFFNGMAQDQWSMFLPHRTEIVIDCSNKQSIQNVQTLANYVNIKENYKSIELPFPNITIKEITYNSDNNLPIFHCENDISINLNSCTWRLEKNNEYYVGQFDNENKTSIQEKLSELIGKEVKQIEIANPMMDAKFQIGNEYVLKVFTCCGMLKQWEICSKNESIFSTNITHSKLSLTSKAK